MWRCVRTLQDGGGELAYCGRHGLREVQERRGVDRGHGAAMGECNGNFRRRNVVRKFGDGEEIKAPGGEKCGVNGAAELFQGSPNHGETVLRSLSQMAPSLIGETNLQAIVGHGGLVSGGEVVWVFNPAPVRCTCQVRRTDMKENLSG